MTTTRQDGTTQNPSHHKTCRQLLGSNVLALGGIVHWILNVKGTIGRAYANHTNAMKHINMDLRARQHARRLLWVTRRNIRIITCGVHLHKTTPKLRSRMSRDPDEAGTPPWSLLVR